MVEQVLAFWFIELSPKKWWVKEKALDRTIAERFLSLHAQACRGELYHWRDTARGSLAEILLLDQFSRNIFRDSPKAFDNDAMALVLAQTMIEKQFDKQLSSDERVFVYLPFMHSESLAIHEVAVSLFQALGKPDNLDFEYRHQAIIKRFGRYPHRNAILGRDSTDEELQFLNEPGSRF